MTGADAGRADGAIDDALTRHAGRQVRQALPAMAVAIGLVTALEWSHVDRRALWCWVAAGLLDVTRALVRNVYEERRTRLGLGRPPRWWDRANHASFGLVWGGLTVTAAWWGDTTALWSALVVVLGVVAMAVVVSAGTTERFVIIVACTLTPTVSVMVVRPPWRVVGLCLLVFAGIAAAVQRALHRALSEAVRTAEENRQLADRLERFLADRDPATSLLSRRGFSAALDDLGRRAAVAGREVTVVVANVERLATVNELFGEEVGDAVLRALAARLHEAFDREGALVARLGGDEFAVARTGSDAERSETAARVRAVALEPVALDGRVLQVELHVADATGPAASTAELVAGAMAAVTRQRSQRRSGVPDAVDPLAVRRRLLDDLAGGLASGAVAPWFQPIVDSATGDVVGWEALVRWAHPELGVLMPARFLPLAVMGGHSDRLTDLVLDRALAFLASVTPGAGRALRVHVNIDPGDLRRSDVPERVVSALRAHAVAPDALVLEITEQDVLAIDDVVLDNLEALDRLGVDIAVDDFGTGFSSLSHLQLLPVRQLKIDRMFIAALDTPRAATLVEGIIGLAHGMRLGVVAEGVETAAQAERLAAMGCGELQGYLFSPAVPPEQAALVSRPAPVAGRAAVPR